MPDRDKELRDAVGELMGLDWENDVRVESSSLPKGELERIMNRVQNAWKASNA